MNGARIAGRILVVTAVVTMVVAVVGFIATLLLNAFVLDKYNAYGEVPIPGSGSLHLPAGQVTVSFHTRVSGGSHWWRAAGATARDEYRPACRCDGAGGDRKLRQHNDSQQ